MSDVMQAMTNHKRRMTNRLIRLNNGGGVGSVHVRHRDVRGDGDDDDDGGGDGVDESDDGKLEQEEGIVAVLLLLLLLELSVCKRRASLCLFVCEGRGGQSQPYS
jgi:hypothetical protein